MLLAAACAELFKKETQVGRRWQLGGGECGVCVSTTSLA